jgi:hypothetical protein
MGMHIIGAALCATVLQSSGSTNNIMVQKIDCNLKK